MPDAATELRDALHAYAETVEPTDESWAAVAVRRPARVGRSRRLLVVSAAAGLAVVMLVAVVALRPSRTRVDVGPAAGKGFPTNPPYPDLGAPLTRHAVVQDKPRTAYVLLNQKVNGETVRLVAWVQDGGPCFASATDAMNIGITCGRSTVPLGANEVSGGSDSVGHGNGTYVFGVASAGVRAVELRSPSGVRLVVPALRLPGTDIRVWAAIGLARGPALVEWHITGYDADGNPVTPPPTTAPACAPNCRATKAPTIVRQHNP
jgi:hypothetical protein